MNWKGLLFTSYVLVVGGLLLFSPSVGATLFGIALLVLVAVAVGTSLVYGRSVPSRVR